MNELFLSVLEEEFENARKSGNIDRSSKIQKVVDLINDMSAPPPEFEVINELVAAPDDARRNQILDKLDSEQLAAVVEMLMNVMPQVEAGGDAETAEAVKSAYRLALRRSMRMSLQKS